MKTINILIGLVLANLLMFYVVIPPFLSSASDILVTIGVGLTVAIIYLDVNVLARIWIKYNKKDITNENDKK